MLRANPSVDPLIDAPRLLGAPLAPLQSWALKRIDERFALRTLHRDRDGFAVVVLERRPR
jgi:hypothetical protein